MDFPSSRMDTISENCLNKTLNFRTIFGTGFGLNESDKCFETFQNLTDLFLKLVATLCPTFKKLKYSQT